MAKKYNHKELEEKWSRKWSGEKIYSPKDFLKAKNKFYNLWMFPYPSAEGLHAGHAFASTGSDVYGRYRRMNGATVFQPIGYDSFGIHSENFAIKTGHQPHELISKTTKNYARQLSALGHGYDWTRTVTTSDENYYKWTQWLFSEMFKAGLAYRKSAEVNWCPSCKTVLADEQVMTPRAAEKLPKEFKSYDEVPDGTMVCERCGTIVTKKNLEQWFFRIKEYANRLLDNLEDINWPDKIKIAQTNWIGKKEGINISYNIKGSNSKITCWTSRPETNFGATFIVVSPESPLVENLTTSDNKTKVNEYIKKSLSAPKVADKKKTGVFTGSYAINPFTNNEMPIYISDYVLADVGTGAVVGVPGHDKRDFEFAKAMSLPIKRVIVGDDGKKNDPESISEVVEGSGTIVNSGFLDGLTTGQGMKKIMGHIEKKGLGQGEIHYHLRDWLISRQRYWGPPIPMIHCTRCAKNGRSWFTESVKNSKRGPKPLFSKQSDWESAGWYPEENLPVLLPKIKDYLPKGTGRGPLADHPEFYQVTCPECGAEATRETDVSDTFLDSAWYFLRYPTVGSKNSSKTPFDADITLKTLPVDLYFGGAEHAVLHLMYARFATMVLYDLGHISFEEPFPYLYAHGLMIKDGSKMSKSKGNVVNPDSYLTKFGADTLRLYLMFMGPMDGYPDFRDTGIEGMRRFTERVWSLYQDYPSGPVLSKEDEAEIMVKMHQTIKKVTEDIEHFRYNTSLAKIMEFVNLLREKALGTSEIGNSNSLWTESLKVLAQLLAPFAPFMSEEVWSEILGQNGSVHVSKWPKYNKDLVKEISVTIAVQVNGKLRDTLKLSESAGTDKNAVLEAARASEKVGKYLKGQSAKEIFVPGKIVNFVTSKK